MHLQFFRNFVFKLKDDLLLGVLKSKSKPLLTIGTDGKLLQTIYKECKSWRKVEELKKSKKLGEGRRFVEQSGGPSFSNL